MLPVLLLASLLAAQGLNADVIWYDELASIGHAGGLTGPFSVADVMDSALPAQSKAAVRYSSRCWRAWGALASWHHLSLRAMSWMFGLLALAWVYRIGRDFVNWRVGFWASAFLAANVFWLEYLHEIRMYSLQLMLIMALIWHYLLISPAIAPSALASLAGSGCSSDVGHLYAADLHIRASGARHLSRVVCAEENRTWLQVSLAFLLAGLLYLPWLPVTLHGLDTKFDTGGDQSMTFGLAIDTCVSLLGNGSWIMVALPLLSVARQLRDKTRRQRLTPIWILTLLILALLLLVNETIGLIPLRRARYFLMAWGLPGNTHWLRAGKLETLVDWRAVSVDFSRPGISIARRRQVPGLSRHHSCGARLSTHA